MKGRGSGSVAASSVPRSAGISMSRNTTSGLERRDRGPGGVGVAGLADDGDAADLLEQGPQPRPRRRLVVDDHGADHAGTSREAGARRRVGCHYRHRHPGDGAAAGVVARQRERGRVAEVAAQPIADAAQAELLADAAREARRVGARRPGPGPLSITSTVSRSPADPGDHLEHAVAAHLRDAVLHGVLDQGVHEHRRHQGRVAASGVGVDRVAEPRAEPRLLDVEIRGRERQLLIERRPLALGAPQGVAEDLRQLLDGAVGAGRVGVDERGHGVQRVEEEVRVDLRAQRLQLRLARLHAQLLRQQVLLLAALLQPDVLHQIGDDRRRASAAASGPR